MEINLETLSQRAINVLLTAIRFALRLKHRFLGSEHILWALSEDPGPSGEILRLNGLESSLIEDYIRQYDLDAIADGSYLAVQVSDEAEQLIHISEHHAKSEGREKSEPEDLLYGILNASECAAAQMMLSLEVDLSKIRHDLDSNQKSANLNFLGTEQTEQNDQPFLKQYGTDMTETASKGTYDPMIGRTTIMERLIQILCRRTKNNPILVGEPGVGKTAIIEGLAQRIVDGNVPSDLKTQKIISMDLSGMISGTRFRGDFEERIKHFIEEAENEKNVILFIDELHMIVGAGAGGGSMDAANILKPVLSRSNLQIIGATTIQEYRHYIEKDSALARRFQPVEVPEPDRDNCIQILMGLRPQYEEFHHIHITDDAIQAAVELSERYITDRFLPDKAIDLIDEAAAKVHINNTKMPPQLVHMEQEIQQISQEKKLAAHDQNYETAAMLRDRQNALTMEFHEKETEWQKKQQNIVNKETIAQIISAWTKIPTTMLMSSNEAKNLQSLEQTLCHRIIGQDEAVHAVSQAIRRGRTGVADPERPIGSFLFLGPTGVGKTELSRSLAEIMFHSEDAIIRFDMSEYMEKYTVSKLIGSPPGYVGYDEGGQLTELVRRHPYSIILFDEIEKAHPDIWNTLLQILDNGRLTDSQGRTVNFKNTVIIMTSNIGAREITGKKGAFGFVPYDSNESSQHELAIQQQVMDAVKQTFRPEFLNRLDEIIVFHPLSEENVRKIADIQIEQLILRMKEKGISLNVKNDVRNVLAKQGFDPAYGARPLKRKIQSTLQNAIADRILETAPLSPAHLTATVQGGKIIVTSDSMN